MQSEQRAIPLLFLCDAICNQNRELFLYCYHVMQTFPCRLANDTFSKQIYTGSAILLEFQNEESLMAEWFEQASWNVTWNELS